MTDSRNTPAAAPRSIGVLKVGNVQRAIVRGVHALPGQGNTVVIETARGNLVVDAGPGGRATASLIADTRALTGRAVSHLVYSHGHAGYNYGVPDWLADAQARGESRPLVVGHRNVAARYRRYVDTAGLQALLNGLQFRLPLAPTDPRRFVAPDLAFDERLVIDGGDRTVELLAAPSETDDTIAAWLPQERFLYGSAAVIRSMPNIGTPLRTFRDTLRWADTLERLAALRPAVLLGEFGDAIVGEDTVAELFAVTIAALRWLRREVVARMNAGLHVDDIVHDLVYPSWFDHHWLRPIYGAPEYVVRDIWRSENGWWDRNPSTLHPVAPAAAAADLRDAVGDADTVIARARALADGGRTQLALHVIDLVALQPDDAPGVARARELKAELACRRATEVAPVVSRNLYRSAAEALRGQPLGSTRDDDPTAGFRWN